MLWSNFARRYMFSPKSHSVINIIAFVSLVAVVVPTAAMIILLAMFSGLTKTIDSLTMATDADIEVVAARGSNFDAEEVDHKAVARIEGVEQVASYLEQSVIATSAGRRIPITLRGVDSTYFAVVPVEQYLYAGRSEGRIEGLLGPWDVAAGTLILAEAGGVTTDFHGGDTFLNGREVVASNGCIHQPLLQIVGRSFSDTIFG